MHTGALGSTTGVVVSTSSHRDSGARWWRHTTMDSMGEEGESDKGLTLRL